MGTFLLLSAALLLRAATANFDDFSAGKSITQELLIKASLNVSIMIAFNGEYRKLPVDDLISALSPIQIEISTGFVWKRFAVV